MLLFAHFFCFYKKISTKNEFGKKYSLFLDEFIIYLVINNMTCPNLLSRIYQFNSGLSSDCCYL